MRSLQDYKDGTEEIRSGCSLTMWLPPDGQEQDVPATSESDAHGDGFTTEGLAVGFGSTGLIGVSKKDRIHRMAEKAEIGKQATKHA